MKKSIRHSTFCLRFTADREEKNQSFDWLWDEVQDVIIESVHID